MAEGSFNFWAPGQTDTSGVQQGASLLAQGGQAMAQGIAAAGEAKGNAYKQLGADISKAVEYKAAEKKKEELADSVSDYFDMANDPKAFDPVPWSHAENQTHDPVFRGWYDEYTSAEGDPNANLGALHTKQTQRFMEHYGKSRADAEVASQGLLKVHTKQVLNPEHRASLQKERARLIGLGMSPQALYTMSQGRGMGGSANLQSLNDEMADEAMKSFFKLTPGEEENLHYRKEEYTNQRKAQAAAQAKQKTELKIQSILYENIKLPVGVNGMQLPTGLMQPRGHEAVTLEGETGNLEQYLGRAKEAGYPLGPIRKAMAEQHGVQFITKHKAAELRKALRDSGIPESGIDAEMTSLMAFSGRSDPNYDEWIKGQIETIEKGKLAPEFQKRDPSEKYSGKQDDAYKAALADIGTSKANGSNVDTVPLGRLQNIDLEAFSATLSPGERADMLSVMPRILVGRDGEGGRQIIMPTGSKPLTDGMRIKLNQLLDSQDVNAELGLQLATGGHSSQSKDEVNSIMRRMMRNEPEQYAELTGAAPGHVNVPGSGAGRANYRGQLGHTMDSRSTDRQGELSNMPSSGGYGAPTPLSTEGMDMGSSVLFDQMDIPDPRKFISGPTVTPNPNGSPAVTPAPAKQPVKPAAPPTDRQRADTSRRRALLPPGDDPERRLVVGGAKAEPEAPAKEEEPSKPDVGQRVKDTVEVLLRAEKIQSGNNSTMRSLAVRHLRDKLQRAHEAGDTATVEEIISNLPQWAKETAKGIKLPKMRMGALEGPFKKRYDTAISKIKDENLRHARYMRSAKYKSQAYEKFKASSKAFGDLAFELEQAYREGRNEDAQKIMRRWNK